MNSLLALFAAALLAQSRPATPDSADSAEAQQPVQVEAGTMTYDTETERYDLREGVVLRRGEVTVRAPAVRYDPKTGEVNAVGGVLLFEPGRVVAADGLHAIVDGPYEARQVVAFFKDQPLDLSAAKTLDEGRRQGRNRLTICGNRVNGEVQGERFDVDSAEITLCDCGGAPPSWMIKSKRADVVPGDRAILTWPVIYMTPRFLFVNPDEAEKKGLLKPIPILPLPWLYVPLAERQTGLLIPQLSYTLTAGWAVSQPLFITLGRSWDATITADYAFGRDEEDLRNGKRGVRGPGASFELRWAPVEGAGGALRVWYLHDRERSWSGSQFSEPHGERLSLALRHSQRFSDSTFFASEIALVNDANYVADFTGDVLLRRASYGRSGIALTHRTEDWLFEGDTAYHIPLGNAGEQDRYPGVARLSYGLFGSDIPVFHRLPSASATMLPIRLLGPLSASASVGIARFAPIHGVTGDEGSSGIGPGNIGYGTVANPTDGRLNGSWQPGERLAATRLATRLELRAPWAMTPYLAVEPWARINALGYSFAAAVNSQVDEWMVGGVTFSSQLFRTFGEGPSPIRHLIEPRVEWAGGGLESGPALPAYAYDELDGPRAFPGIDPSTSQPYVLPRHPLSAMPPGGFQQLRMALRNRLVVPSGTGSQNWVGLDMGQDFDLRAGRRSESWARVDFDSKWFAGNALARFFAFGAQPLPGAPIPEKPSVLDRFSELRLGMSVKDGRGDDIHGSLFSQAAGGSPQTKAGIDALFDPRPLQFSTVAQMSAGAHAVLSGLDASYDVLLYARSDNIHKFGDIQQHTLSVKWTSPCNCWMLGFTLAVYPDQGTAFQFILDLSKFTGGGRWAP